MEKAEVSVWEVSVNDTYAVYEIKVKSHNRIGESRQPAFRYLGHSGEAGKADLIILSLILLRCVELSPCFSHHKEAIYIGKYLLSW